MCTHTRKAETKNNSRIMQSSSFILERSFLLEYFRKQNKCDLYATWFDMQMVSISPFVNNTGVILLIL